MNHGPGIGVDAPGGSDRGIPGHPGEDHGAENNKRCCRIKELSAQGYAPAEPEQNQRRKDPGEIDGTDQSACCGKKYA